MSEPDRSRQREHWQAIAEQLGLAPEPEAGAESRPEHCLQRPRPRSHPSRQHQSRSRPHSPRKSGRHAEAGGAARWRRLTRHREPNRSGRPSRSQRSSEPARGRLLPQRRVRPPDGDAGALLPAPPPQPIRRRRNQALVVSSPTRKKPRAKPPNLAITAAAAAKKERAEQNQRKGAQRRKTPARRSKRRRNLRNWSSTMSGVYPTGMYHPGMS
jgi:hypothetical protein